jgi:hypothetical protein
MFGNEWVHDGVGEFLTKLAVSPVELVHDAESRLS